MKTSLLPLVLAFVSLFAGQASGQTKNTDTRTLLEEAANAMGGLEKLRAVENQVIVSEGRQFEPEQSLVPGGPARHVADSETLKLDVKQIVGIHGAVGGVRDSYRKSTTLSGPPFPFRPSPGFLLQV